jgi:FlaA1/EpsC-like NDP-sugar epimerase
MRPSFRASDLLLPCLDGLIAVGSIALAFVARFDLGSVLQAYLSQLVGVASISLLLKPAIFLAVGLYRVYWRHAGLREILRLLLAVVIASISLSLLVALLQSPLPSYRGIPQSIFLVDFLATAMGVSLLRLLVHARLAEGTRSPGRG